MQDLLNGFKEVWDMLIAMGWYPLPSFLAIVAILGARAYWEPDVLAVVTPEDKVALGRLKGYIFWGVLVTSFFMQVGLAKPHTVFDWFLSIGFCVGHTAMGYVISSISLVRDFTKRTIKKEAV